MKNNFTQLAGRPATRGAALALVAAVLFGISTPLVQFFGRGVGSFATAALLYAGAALIGALMTRQVDREARVLKRDGWTLAAVALFGALIGPVALAWGLQHTSGMGASLMLTLEALFTVLLARMLYRESMDLRVWMAVLLLFAGALVLVVDQTRDASHFAANTPMWGLLAVAVATFAWGIDNTLSRALAERDPGQVVMIKATLGACATALLGYLFGESFPASTAVIGLLVVGATGYGLSLRFYLLAQRSFGAGRTGSVFAFAPFIGALFAMALGDRSASMGLAAGGLLMLAGVVLHLIESHGHEHTHHALEHEHAHQHDDGHHEHSHGGTQAGQGTHSHWHQHEPTRHSHAHAPDVHHGHTH